MAELRNTGDAYVSNAAGNQKKNFSGTQKLYVKAANPDTRYGYLYFGAPFPQGRRGIKVLRAYIELHNGTVIEGGTLSVQRISQAWKRNKITWDNKPNVAGAIATTTKNGNVPINTAWRVNLTAMMQAVADGAAWYGVRFTMNDGKGEWFYGSAAKTSGLRPLIVVEYVEAPDEPTNLSPANGASVTKAKPLLTFQWTDDRGSTALSAVRVQVSASANMTGAWDSGWVDGTLPELDLAGTSYPGAASGSTVYWRVQVRDASGTDSAWSDVANFKITPMGTVTIISPTGAEPDAYVEENTPPILWNFSGTQVHWQVVLADPSKSGRIIANSGKITSGVQGWTVPAKAKMVVGKEYDVIVRVWDNVVRAQNDDVAPYAVARKRFKVKFTNQVTPVNSLEVTQVSPYHWTRLQWKRGTSADQYEIYAGNTLKAKINAADIDFDGNVYQAVIRTAPPRRDVAWKVVAVVNGRGSENNPVVTKNFKARSAVLSEVNGSSPIMFLNYERDGGDTRQQTLHDVVGDYPPVMIKQARGGKSGSFVGILGGNAVPGVSVDTERDRWESLDEDEGRTVLLTVLDESFECFLSDGVIQSFADAEGLYYEVSFDYYEVDF